jgi:hypothetical protein
MLRTLAEATRCSAVPEISDPDPSALRINVERILSLDKYVAGMQVAVLDFDLAAGMQH